MREGKEYQFLSGLDLTCPECAGSGFVFNDPADRLTSALCPRCHGTKVVGEYMLNVVKWN